MAPKERKGVESLGIVLFILGIVMIVGSIVLAIFAAKSKEGWFVGVSVGGFIIGLILALITAFFAQDVGQVVVLRNWGGSIAGTSVDAGFHMKAPWQDTITYDVRNNVLSFMGDEETDQFEGGSANGSHVTINDRGGASATIDIQVNYSLDPQAAEELYANYGTQENFVKSICAVDIRAVPREVSGQFDTISILTARGEFTNAIQEALTDKWKNYGLIVEQVSVQNVVYPQSIVDSYAASQSAEIAKAKAQNEQETAKVEAETKVIQAQAEAEANRLLNESLSQNVVMYEYVQALKDSGKLFVVPSDSMPMINVE